MYLSGEDEDKVGLLFEDFLAELGQGMNSCAIVVSAVVWFIELIHGASRKSGSREGPVFQHSCDTPEFHPMDFRGAEGTYKAVEEDVLLFKPMKGSDIDIERGIVVASPASIGSGGNEIGFVACFLERRNDSASFRDNRGSEVFVGVQFPKPVFCSMFLERNAAIGILIIGTPKPGFGGEVLDLTFHESVVVRNGAINVKCYICHIRGKPPLIQEV